MTELSFESILEKIKNGSSCEEAEYEIVFRKIVDSLERELNFKLLFDVQPVSDASIVRCIAYEDEMLLGTLKLSVLVNVVISLHDSNSIINADVMLYSNSERLDKNYDSGSYFQLSCEDVNNLSWVVQGWKPDEYGDYDSFRTIEE